MAVSPPLPWAPHRADGQPSELARLLKARGPLLILGAGGTAYAVLLLAISRHFGFAEDEFRFITERWQWNAHTLLSAYNGHWVLAQVLFYKLLFFAVGLHHTWPYRLALVAAHLSCVGLVYRLARRYTDDWTALLRLNAANAQASAELELAPGATLYLDLPAGGSSAIRARRLSPTYARQPTFILPSSDTPAKLHFPIDTNRIPWQIKVALAPATIACAT